MSATAAGAVEFGNSTMTSPLRKRVSPGGGANARPMDTRGGWTCAGGGGRIGAAKFWIGVGVGRIGATTARNGPGVGRIGAVTVQTGVGPGRYGGRTGLIGVSSP